MGVYVLLYKRALWNRMIFGNRMLLSRSCLVTAQISH